ncbi:Myeloid leukemia factor 2 [Frankliniella fusca]|uniref:Myeloid leukemia factor 2 n=1 Tax=Frankliniella fusca TaxID=407009 RepID=A0AAE1HDG8_9NEOP|nr:Myeloid leukemia factor 2 [Frankliniella fusca]
MMGMGDPDDDPIFGTMRQMDSMINSMFSDPFGMMGGMMGGHRAINQGARPRSNQMSQMNQIAPFGNMFGGGLFGGGMFGGGMMGFPNMNRLFDNMSSMSNDPNCHSFSSSTVMTMSSGPNGQPQVYQASATTRSGPGGIKETKKTVCDSRTGVKKMAIGHHIGDRAHIVEREKNVYTGEEEQREDLVNLDEEEAPLFNREWEQKTGTVGVAAVTGRSNGRYQEQLALPSTAAVSPSTTSSLRAKARAAARARRSQLAMSNPSRVEITEVTDDDDEDANAASVSEERSASPIIEYPSAPSNSQKEQRDRERYHPTPRTHVQEHQEGSRKRDLDDDYEERRRHHKSRKPY